MDMSNLNNELANLLEGLGGRHPKLLLVLASAYVVTLIIAIVTDALALRRGTHAEKTLAEKPHS
jgi:hypothetical protein